MFCQAPVEFTLNSDERRWKRTRGKRRREQGQEDRRTQIREERMGDVVGQGGGVKGKETKERRQGGRISRGRKVEKEIKMDRMKRE